MADTSYQRFFASLPLPAVVVDHLGFIQQANARASDMLELSHQVALQHKSMLLYLSPQARRELQWSLNNTSRHETHDMPDVQLHLADGVNLPCNIHITQLDNEPDSQGYATPLSLLVFVDQTPVQAQRVSEDRYRQQTQRLGEVIWASQSGFWEWDVTQTSLLCNERWAEIQGYTLDELMPLNLKGWVAMVHPEDQAQIKTMLRELLAADSDSFDLKCRLAHKLGGWVWVQNRGRVLERDEDNKPSRVAGALVDISNEMAQAQALEAAKLAAEEAQRINTEFMANLSHEIRTPLNSVLGLIQLLRETPLEESQQTLLQQIGQSGQMLSRTLNELLDHAKLEAGGVELEHKPLKLRELLGSTMVMFNHHAKKAGVGLVAEVAPDVPDGFLGDSLRLQQVMNNLLSNAIKFTERGHVAINVSRLHEREPGQLVLMIEVQDTGIGIKKLDQARLFTPFFQSDASITRRFGGTGLGLSICKRLVGLMGGEIGVDSIPGKGSRFWFTAHFTEHAQAAEPMWVPSKWQMGQVGDRTSKGTSSDNALKTRPYVSVQRPQIDALEEALRKHDIKAIDLAHNLMQSDEASNEEFFRMIKNRLDVYDFHGALNYLETIKP
jgi:PAS domain S-box-containing protein